VVSAITQTPASGPLPLATTPPKSLSPMLTAAPFCWANTCVERAFTAPASAIAATPICQRAANLISPLLFACSTLSTAAWQVPLARQSQSVAVSLSRSQVGANGRANDNDGNLAHGTSARALAGRACRPVLVPPALLATAMMTGYTGKDIEAEYG